MSQPEWMPRESDWTEKEKAIVMPDRVDHRTESQDRVENSIANCAPEWEIDYWETVRDSGR